MSHPESEPSSDAGSSDGVCIDCLALIDRWEHGNPTDHTLGSDVQVWGGERAAGHSASFTIA